MNTVYIPIDCDFYDILEEASTLRQNCEVVYVSSKQSSATVQGTITNLYVANGKEFLVMNSFLHIGLDALVSVNGKPVPNTELLPACSS